MASSGWTNIDLAIATAKKTQEATAELNAAIRKGADQSFLMPLADRQAARGQWEQAERLYTLAARRGRYWSKNGSAKLARSQERRSRRSLSFDRR